MPELKSMVWRGSAAAIAVALGLGFAGALGQAPPAGPPPGEGSGGPPGLPPGIQISGLAPVLALTLVPDVAATIDVDVPGGLQGPQGSVRLEYTGLGEADGKSPPLTWTAGAGGTGSYAIVLQDLARTRTENTFLHWALYNVPAETTSLPEGIKEGADVAEVPGAKQLISSMGAPRYIPPGPRGMSVAVTPVGGEDEINLYALQVFALDTVLDLAADASFEDLAAAMKGHVLGYGIELVALQRGGGGGPPPGGPPAGGPPAGAAPGAPPAGAPPPQ